MVLTTADGTDKELSRKKSKGKRKPSAKLRSSSSGASLSLTNSPAPDQALNDPIPSFVPPAPPHEPPPPHKNKKKPKSEEGIAPGSVLSDLADTNVSEQSILNDRKTLAKSV
jgi:hypothetical protein